MIIYDYFSSVFCIVSKKVLLLKYRKWVSHLKNRYHYAKVVENARINFSVSPYCTLLFSRKENVIAPCCFLEKKTSNFGSSFISCSDKAVFCIVPKKALLLKYRKWVSHLKNRYHYAKVVENARINFSISPYCTLLFYRKENFNFFEVALPDVLCNGAIGCIMNMWGYQPWNTANTALDIYLLFKKRP